MRPVPSERRSDGECHRVDHFQPVMQPLSEASIRVEGNVTIAPLSSETEHEPFDSLGYSMYLSI